MEGSRQGTAQAVPPSVDVVDLDQDHRLAALGPGWCRWASLNHNAVPVLPPRRPRQAAGSRARLKSPGTTTAEAVQVLATFDQRDRDVPHATSSVLAAQVLGQCAPSRTTPQMLDGERRTLRTTRSNCTTS